MKLSKQERIAALIILAIIVLALGAFLIIKPAVEDWNSAKTTVISKRAELDNLNTRRATKDQLRTDIEKAFEEGEHKADMFFPEFKSYDADDALRAFLKQCKSNVVVEEVTVSEPATATLSATFYTPTSVEYALKTYATSGVEPTEEELKIQSRTEALMSALSEEQTIGASQVEFVVSSKSRDEILKFADEVNNYKVNENGTEIRKAIMLGGIEIEYEEVNQKYDALVEDNVAEMDAEGERALAAEIGKTPEIKNDTGAGQEGDASLEAYLFSYDATLTFFSIERMQDPKAQLDAQDGIVS